MLKSYADSATSSADSATSSADFATKKGVRNRVRVRTSIRVKVPSGLGLELRSRSGLALPFGVRVGAEVLVATAWFLGNSRVGSRWQSLGCHALATRQACFC